MIRDARVLQPEFVPRDIVHRTTEVNGLSAALDPVTREQQGETTLLHGPSGVGKTCIARYMTDQLHETVLDLNTQYVNCWEDYSRFKTLYRILEGINQTLDVHRQSTPKDELLERLRDYDGPPLPVTARKLDACYRLAEASARMRLSDTVEMTDIEFVTPLIERSLADIGIAPQSNAALGSADDLDAGEVGL